MNQITLTQAKSLFRQGKLKTTPKPVHSGRRKNWYPIQHNGTRLKVAILGVTIDYPLLEAICRLEDNGQNVSQAARDGIILAASKLPLDK